VGKIVLSLAKTRSKLGVKPYIKLIKAIRLEGLLVYLVRTFPELERAMNLRGIGFQRA